jgi:hypothetical protein
METDHAETVVEKAVNFVKDVFGVQHDASPKTDAEPPYEDTEPEVTAEQAMSLDPNAYTVSPSGQVVPASTILPEVLTDPEPDSDDEQVRRKSLAERNEDLVRRENNL